MFRPAQNPFSFSGDLFLCVQPGYGTYFFGHLYFLHSTQDLGPKVFLGHPYFPFSIRIWDRIFKNIFSLISFLNTFFVLTSLARFRSTSLRRGNPQMFNAVRHPAAPASNCGFPDRDCGFPHRASVPPCRQIPTKYRFQTTTGHANDFPNHGFPVSNSPARPSNEMPAGRDCGHALLMIVRPFWPKPVSVL